MKKTKILLLFLISITFLSACSSISDGFRSQKKNSIDEFMVEKKSPLVMPPDFDELPVPNKNIQNKEKKTDIKSLISNNEDSSNTTQKSSNQNTNFENSILEKIKKN